MSIFAGICRETQVRIGTGKPLSKGVESMPRTFRFVLSLLTALTLAVGCDSADKIEPATTHTSETKTSVPQSEEEAAPPSTEEPVVDGTAADKTAAEKPSAPETVRPASAPGSFEGKVVETVTASRYTYVLVDTGEKKIWAAAPSFQVKVGDEVLVPSGMPMNSFYSRTLDRTFDRVYFAARVVVKGATATSPEAPATLPEGHPPLPGTEKQVSLPKGHPPLPGAGEQRSTPPPAGGDAPKIDLSAIEIEKAEGGLTVAEIFASKSDLAGKEVLLRAKVVKFNARILETNWLHVRDGSGSEGTNDLTVTTKAKVGVGDTVLIRGAVSLDRDFGSGYKYDVLVEDATVTVESPVGDKSSEGE